MPIKFKMDFSKIKQKALKGAVWVVSDTTNVVYSDIRQFSPIDTWRYLSGHRHKWVRLEQNRVVWEIENVGAYPERVEKWFRKTPVNWNLRNLWQIYYSKWANVYQKALAKNKDNFSLIIKNPYYSYDF